MPFVVSSRGLCLTGQGSSHQTSSELLNTSSGHPVDTDTKNDEKINVGYRKCCAKTIYDYKMHKNCI